MIDRIKRTWNSPRRWVILLLLLIAGLVIGGLIAFAVSFQRAATPETPGAFYTPPQPLPDGPPGTIIRSEPLPANLPDGAQAWRVMYLSSDLDGNPIAVTGTVAAPAAESAEPRPVIAWAHGTTGILPQCGVSHTSDPYQQTPVVQRMIDEGFVVTITDYPGLGTPGVHPYMVGKIAAQSVLDSVRAARLLDVQAGDEFVVWGASQGGHSSLWTAQLAGTYAPELTLLGAAASAPATDLPRIGEANMDFKPGGIFLGYLFYAWSTLYPGANLDDIILPERREEFESMIEPCFTAPAEFLTVGGILSPEEYLSVDVTKTEPWATLMVENTPRDPIDVPIIIAHGTADDLIPIELSEAEAARRCADGEDVQFARFPGTNHDARDDSGVMILGWVMDRFAGRPTGSTC